MSFFNFLKKADLLSQSPNLKVNNNDFYHTIVGGFLSIIIVLLSLLGGIYFSLMLINKENPLVATSEQVESEVPVLKVGNKEDLIVFFGLEYSNFTYFKDDRVYTVTAINSVVRFENGKQIYEDNVVEIDSCSKYYSSKEEMGVDEDYNLELLYCIKPNQLEIKGLWGSEIYSALIISVDLSQNSTTSNSCYDLETIASLVENGVISIKISNTFVNTKNYTNPTSKYFSDSWNRLSLLLKQQYTYELRKLVFTTDSGILLESSHSKVSFLTIAPNIMYTSRSKSDSTVASILVEYSKIGKSYFRHYSKIQDVITRIGGLIKALMIISQIITQANFNWVFYYDLAVEYNSLSSDFPQKSNSKNNIKANINNINSSNIQVDKSSSKLKNDSKNKLDLSQNNLDVIRFKN